MYLSQFIALDLPPLLTAIFSASACALLGTYLLLRKQSMMGDAISHSVLPGIVVAFLLTSSRGGFTIFVGAAIAGLLSAVLIELTRRFGSVESGAAMGVVFSLFFAAGIVILEQAAARSIDLDADCLLHGQLESIFWYPPTGASSLLSYETIEKLPIEVWTSFITLALTLGFILVLFKELQFASFDPALASASGFSSTLIHHLLMAMVACAVVASFKAVGSILVIAMIICPAACARLCTDKLVTQLYLSVLFAVLASILGYFSGAFGPILFGFENSVNAAGMIAVTAGILLGLCVFLAPRYGVIAKNLRRLQLQQRVFEEDILAFLFRIQEGPKERYPLATKSHLIAAIRDGYTEGKSTFHNIVFQHALSSLFATSFIRQEEERIELTSMGAAAAARQVRSHRLWESYLVNRLGLTADHVHLSAEKLEHFTAPEVEAALEQRTGKPTKDPHGKSIPGRKL